MEERPCEQEGQVIEQDELDGNNGVEELEKRQGPWWESNVQGGDGVGNRQSVVVELQ